MERNYPALYIIVVLFLQAVVAIVDVKTASLISPRAGISTIEAESKVYFIGGFENGELRATKTIEVYDLIAQNMSTPLQLDTPRAFVTPVVIEPNIYFVGGINYINAPFFYDPSQHQFGNHTVTGPTVAKPIDVQLHDLYFIVIGTSGVDVFDANTIEWKNTAPLKNLFSDLARSTILSAEGIVIVIGGFNVTTELLSLSVWVYYIESGDLHEYEGLLPTTFKAFNPAYDLIFGSNGIVTVSLNRTILVHHVDRRAWQTFELPSLYKMLSSSSLTFLFNASYVIMYDWNQNETTTDITGSLIHSFVANDVPVLIKRGDNKMEFQVFDTIARTWNTTNSLSTTFVSVPLSVSLASGWHIFTTTSQGVVYGYHPIVNAIYQVTDPSPLFWLKRITALIPAAEPDQVFIFENGTVTKTQFNETGVQNLIKQQKIAANFVPVTRIGSDFLDATGRFVTLDNPMTVTNPNVQLSQTLLAFNNQQFVIMEGNSSRDIGREIYNRIDVYNYVTNQWGNSTDMPSELMTSTTVRWFYSAAALDNKLVVWMNTVMAVYDPTTGNWTTYTNYTQSMANLMETTVHIPVPTAQGLAFMRTDNRSLDMFNIRILPSWTSTSFAPAVVDFIQYEFRQCLVRNDKQLYLTALISNKGLFYYNTLYVYDIANNAWQSRQQLSNAVTTVPVIALAGDYLLSVNDGLLTYRHLDTGAEDYMKLGFKVTPASVLETTANVTIIAGGVNNFDTYSNKIMIIPHDGIVVNAPLSIEVPTEQLVPVVSYVPTSLSEGELAAAIVVPVGVALIGAALLVFFLVRRSKRRRRQGSASNTIGLAGKYGQWFIPFETIKFGDQLGQGASGQVFKGTWNSTTVALKVSMTQANSSVISELELMMQLRPHPNVIQLFGFSVHPETDSIILVIEYCNGGSLDDALFDASDEIPLQQKLSWLIGIAKGLEHLHANNIVHRDIAARNVLLHQNEPKITDFGMSRLIDEDKQRGTTKSELGPIRWMSPESLRNKEYSNKSDIWSFGVLMFEVIAQVEPHHEADPIEIGRLIRDNGLTPIIPSSCPSELAQLMKQCWDMTPDKRISLEQIEQRLEAMQY